MNGVVEGKSYPISSAIDFLTIDSSFEPPPPPPLPFIFSEKAKNLKAMTNFIMINFAFLYLFYVILIYNQIKRKKAAGGKKTEIHTFFLPIYSNKRTNPF
jgi:hypothetical protein